MLHRGHPSRLAGRAEVAERITELRALRAAVESLKPLALLASLQCIAKAGEGSQDPAAMKQARLALADAARLEARLARSQVAVRWNIDNDVNGFSANPAGDAALRGRPSAPPAPIQRPSRAHPAPRRRPAGSREQPRALPETSSPAPWGLPGRSPAAPPRAPPP